MRCEYCGGSLEMLGHWDRQNGGFRLYRCAECDREGGESWGDDMPEGTWGAVTQGGEV